MVPLIAPQVAQTSFSEEFFEIFYSALMQSFYTYSFRSTDIDQFRFHCVMIRWDGLWAREFFHKNNLQIVMCQELLNYSNTIFALRYSIRITISYEISTSVHPIIGNLEAVIYYAYSDIRFLLCNLLSLCGLKTIFSILQRGSNPPGLTKEN